jgi:putative transposase
MPARVSGCPRVVFNDARRPREQARDAGVRISDSEVQPWVVAVVRTRPERVWLGEVASVALVQACADRRRAYGNFFDSPAGKRKGAAAGRPRFRSRKDNRASTRLTSNGFRATSGRVRGTKIGQVRLKWSRDVPASRPPSLSFGRGGGWYYPAFAVQVVDTPLPATTSEVGIDVGLDRLAALSTEIIDNPRFPVRAPARAQRAQPRTPRGAV